MVEDRNCLILLAIQLVYWPRALKLLHFTPSSWRELSQSEFSHNDKIVFGVRFRFILNSDNKDPNEKISHLTVITFLNVCNVNIGSTLPQRVAASGSPVQHATSYQSWPNVVLGLESRANFVGRSPKLGLIRFSDKQENKVGRKLQYKVAPVGKTTTASRSWHRFGSSLKFRFRKMKLAQICGTTQASSPPTSGDNVRENVLRHPIFLEPMG